MATTLRNDAKNQIIKVLRKQGYPTYARLLDYFDVYLTDNPEVIGYMVPGEAKIVLNKLLNIDQVSTIVRHEILHEYLTHGPRKEKFDKEHPELNPHLAPHDIANIAADFEISNRGYTDFDKATIRGIKLGNQILRGLVTEVEQPGWENLSFEEMYKKLLEQDHEDRKQIQNLLDKISKLTKQDLDDMIQDAQDIQDKMEDQQDSDSSQSSQQPSPQDIKDAAKEAESAAQNVKDAAQDVESKPADSDKVFDTPREQRDKADVAARAKKIRDFIDNLSEQARIQDETAQKITKEKAAKAARDVERYQGSGLNQFKLNLNRFIADQIGELEDDSYARIHPSYEDSEFLVPGKIVREEKNIPLINIYHDVSGSFDSPEKTSAALKAIESLNQYVRDGDIHIELYYFADRISDSRNNAGGGTRGTPILDHIEQTKPTNVIVITDADISDCSRVVTVPGAVWMLFYGGRSSNLMDHLKGKRQNKYYDIDYSKL